MVKTQAKKRKAIKVTKVKMETLHTSEKMATGGLEKPTLESKPRGHKGNRVNKELGLNQLRVQKQ